MAGKQPSQEVVDVRSPAEKALSESQAGYFNRLMERPNFGYESVTGAADPVYAREMNRFKEQADAAAAERGFGPRGHGPTVDVISRGAQEMGENRAAKEAEEMDRYRRWVFSQGRESASPMGRSVMMKPGRPSAFSAIAGPMLGAVGYGVGGPIGGAIGGGIGSGFSRLMGGGGTQEYADTMYARGPSAYKSYN